MQEDEFDLSDLPSVEILKGLTASFVIAAQKQYDAWQQDEDGMDEELGSGGICHLIAEDICSIMHQHSIDTAQTVSATHEQHVYVVAAFEEGVFEIDLPWSVYERGGGYNWTKIPNVVIGPDDITVHCLDREPSRLYIYCDE